MASTWKPKLISARKVLSPVNFSVSRQIEKPSLIVAGGYGHARLGEWMFGGVTRDLLAESRICCLFSH